jgi:hypothetical protein
MRQSGANFGTGSRPGARLSLSGVVLPAVGSIGSIVAWTHWRPPLHTPGSEAQTQVSSALGPLGNGLAASHGLGTAHGAIGLASAVICVGGIIGLFLPGRLRLVAAIVIAVSSAVIAANGLVAFVSANHLHQQWTDLTQAINSSGSKASLNGVSSAIVKRALVPSAAATAAGLIAFSGGLSALRTVARTLRLAGNPRSLGLPGMQ